MNFDDPLYPADVRSNRASDCILRKLRKMIITLELPPGAVLDEAELTRQMGCSRTPLREALRCLAQERLVVAVPRRGVSVADLSILEVGELFETMALLEWPAARLAAQRITDEEIAALEGIFAKLDEAAKAKDLPMYCELDFDFHLAIAAATHNRHIPATIAGLNRPLSRFAYLGLQRAGTMEASLSDHRQILEAIQNRDPEEAERAMREHETAARERMRAAL